MIANLIIRGETVADIGADHARLALYLVENEIAARVIISELGDGPYQRACTAVQRSSAARHISVRQGNGLRVLKPNEAGTVVIAGMGGETITEIMADDEDKADSFKRFIFQPMSKAQVLRRHMADRGWVIQDEILVREKNRYYVIIVSHPGNCPYVLTDLELELGPLILRSDHEINRIFIRRQVRKYRTAYADILHSGLAESIAAAKDYKDKISRLEEILGAKQS